MSKGERLLRVKEAAAFLGYTEGTLRQMMCRRQIPFVYVRHGGGKSPRFRQSALDAMIEPVPTAAEVLERIG